MFDMLEPANVEPQRVVKLEEWPQHELLAAEKELLGFYVTGHPITPFVPLLEKYTLHNSVTAKELPARTLSRLGGLISALQQGVSKKTGKPYAMVTIEDLEGSMSMLCINENYDKYRALLTPGQAVLVIGEVNNDEDRPKIFPQEMMPLEDAPRKYTKQVHLRLYTAHLTPEKLETIHQLAASHRGSCPLFLCLMRPEGQIVFIEAHERFSVAPSLQLQNTVDEMFGADTYYARIDAALPERAARRWPEREGKQNGGGE
jgi:DNA polymerase-3 subunit alpha